MQLMLMMAIVAIALLAHFQVVRPVLNAVGRNRSSNLPVRKHAGYAVLHVAR